MRVEQIAGHLHGGTGGHGGVGDCVDVCQLWVDFGDVEYADLYAAASEFFADMKSVRSMEFA